MPLRLLPLLLLLLLLPACSDSVSNDAAPAAADQHCYVPLRIVIPAAQGEGPLDVSQGAAARTTRADSDEDDQEQLRNTNEYAVHSGVIVLYYGDEMNYLAHYDLSKKENFNNDGYTGDVGSLFTSDPSEFIVSSAYVTMQLDASKISALTGKDLYALIMLNTSGVVSKSDYKDKKYSVFCDYLISSLGDVEHGYFMSNVPMCKKPGGEEKDPSGGEVVTLPEVKAIFTEATATISDATAVFVERAAAKVTLSLAQDAEQQDITETAIIVDGNESNKAKIHDVRWAVDNANNSTYVVRHFEKAWLGYSATATKSSGGTVTYYPLADDEANEVKANYGLTSKEDRIRTFWGESPSLDTYTAVTDDDLTNRINQSVLVHESTRTMTKSSGHYNDRQDAARVVVRVTLKDNSKMVLKGTDYYGLNHDGKAYLFSSKEKLVAWLTGKSVTFPTELESSNNATTTIDSKTVNIYKYGRDGAFPIVYYEAFIKHFDSRTAGGVTYSNIAPSVDGTPGFGKYGIVRNNVYRITLGPLTTIGQPTIPDIGSGAIDE